ncbi:hypothetical protein PM082_010078 [Marasmius tenuissimus]|nr:hypothetical protein PM082_010078 [Marasmius tenuissimus]
MKPCTPNSSRSGYGSAWGVFQAYYGNHLLRNVSPPRISCISSVQNVFAYAPMHIVASLFDMGYFYSLLIPAGLLHVSSVIFTGECKELWQFILCLGVLTGVRVFWLRLFEATCLKHNSPQARDKCHARPIAAGNHAVVQINANRWPSGLCTVELLSVLSCSLSYPEH